MQIAGKRVGNNREGEGEGKHIDSNLHHDTERVHGAEGAQKGRRTN